jgi:protein DJ-1
LQEPKRVLVFLAEGAEEMEVTIVVDVLRRAGIEVTLASISGNEAVRCSRGVRIVPDLALADVQGDFSAVVLPGGAEGARRLSASDDVGAWLVRHEAQGLLVGAICAAPTALKAHGVFRGRRMTSYPSIQPELVGYAELDSSAVVEDGNLITSQGPGTAFAFALALVARLLGKAALERVEKPLLLIG